MIKHLILIALISIVVVSAADLAGGGNIVLAQNATSGNTTVGNSTESLTSSEERGAYSEYGG